MDLPDQFGIGSQKPQATNHNVKCHIRNQTMNNFNIEYQIIDIPKCLLMTGKKITFDSGKKCDPSHLVDNGPALFVA